MYNKRVIFIDISLYISISEQAWTELQVPNRLPIPQLEAFNYVTCLNVIYCRLGCIVVRIS